MRNSYIKYLFHGYSCYQRIYFSLWFFHHLGLSPPVPVIFVSKSFAYHFESADIFEYEADKKVDHPEFHISFRSESSLNWPPVLKPQHVLRKSNDSFWSRWLPGRGGGGGKCGSQVLQRRLHRAVTSRRRVTTARTLNFNFEYLGEF
jgi:hypothetical protein